MQETGIFRDVEFSGKSSKQLANLALKVECTCEKSSKVRRWPLVTSSFLILVYCESVMKQQSISVYYSQIPSVIMNVTNTQDNISSSFCPTSLLPLLYLICMHARLIVKSVKNRCA